MMKICNKCKLEKDISNFNKDKTKKDGYRTICKKCTSIQVKIYRQNFPDKERLTKKKYRLKFKEKFSEYDKNYYIKNREKKLLREKNRNLLNKEKQQAYRLKFKYDLSIEQYNDILKRQNYKCAICNCPVEQSGRWKRLYVDHNHKTGQLRELLCNKCNTTLGLINEDINILNNMINYINKWNHN